MVFDEGKKWNNAVASRGMATERSKTEHKYGKCPLYLEEEDVKHIILDCRNTRNWRLKL